MSLFRLTFLILIQSNQTQSQMMRFIAAIYILAKMASHAFYIYIANVHERDADSAL